MENKNVDDLVAMIDEFMAGKGGHMNVRVESNGSGRSNNTPV